MQLRGNADWHERTHSIWRRPDFHLPAGVAAGCVGLVCARWPADELCGDLIAWRSRFWLVCVARFLRLVGGPAGAARRVRGAARMPDAWSTIARGHKQMFNVSSWGDRKRALKSATAV